MHVSKTKWTPHRRDYSSTTDREHRWAADSFSSDWRKTHTVDLNRHPTGGNITRETRERFSSQSIRKLSRERVTGLHTIHPQWLKGGSLKGQFRLSLLRSCRDMEIVLVLFVSEIQPQFWCTERELSLICEARSFEFESLCDESNSIKSKVLKGHISKLQPAQQPMSNIHSSECVSEHSIQVFLTHPWPPEHLAFAHLQWFNFSPCCSDAQVCKKPNKTGGWKNLVFSLVFSYSHAQSREAPKKAAHTSGLSRATGCFWKDTLLLILFRN